MFKAIFSFEFKGWFKRPPFYIFFCIYVLLAWFATAAAGGVFGGAAGFSRDYINSAYAVSQALNGLNTDFILGIILIAIMAPAIYKDFKYNTHPLLFTKPINKFSYVFGRFLGAFSVALIVLLGIVIGHMIGCATPGVDEELLGSFNLMNYIQPFLIFVVPNTLLIGALFFSLVTFTRNMMAGYVGCIVLLIFKSMASAMLADLDNQTVAALVDPFGEQAFNNVTRYWTMEEKNTQLVPLSGLLLGNRLLWLGISVGVTLLTFYRFKFAQFTSPIKLFGKKKQTVQAAPSKLLHTLADLPKVAQTFTTKFHLKQLFYLAKREIRPITRSVFFMILVGLAIGSAILVSTILGLIYGTNTYPVTYQMLQMSGAFFQFFMIIVIVFYSGTLIWKERDSKTDELVGSSPVPNWVIFGGKLLALIGVQGILLVVLMLTCMGIQAYNGYYQFELDQYLITLFGFRWLHMAIFCALAMAIQVMTNQKIVGYFLTAIVILVIPSIYGALEWNHKLYQFNSSGPQLPYSDMNGYGHTPPIYFLFKLYWVSFVSFLIVISGLMYVRSKERGFKYRFGMIRKRTNMRSRLAMIGALLVFFLTGGFIYYNTNVLNEYRTPYEVEVATAEFEKKYKKYENTPQPRVAGVNLHVDIFPYERKVAIQGHYVLKNKTQTPIDSIHINIFNTIEINNMTFDRSFKEAYASKEDGYYIFALDQPLTPGSTVQFDMDIAFAEKGFPNSGTNSSIVYNGTFFNSSYLPSIGYNASSELINDKARKAHDLPPKERMADVNDMHARQNTYIANDADWIDFEVVVSTVPDQIAIAPGYLQREWEDGGRKYYHYKMDSKILNFYSFLSARYEVTKDQWNDVNIEIFHHEGHDYNIDRMIKAIKQSLDYYTANFSPYQHKQVRILEFPRYATFAQSFPNTIPFSESIGFIAKVDDEDPLSIDYPYYVTAHEVAHQWWAHQVIGGNVQGSTILSETMSQYSALMVMKKEYGRQQMKKFLKYEMDQYLMGRTFEWKKELPLILVENQQYIHYNKGSVVMYALQDYIGEDSLNKALSRYIDAVAFQEPPYTNSYEFLTYIRAVTPDSLQYLITDMFEKITLYENRVQALSYTETEGGKYKVELTVVSKKTQADSLNKQQKMEVNDWIDIGVFTTEEVDGKTKDKELYLQKHKITGEETTLEIIVDEKPEKAGIDPYNILIDKTPDNNTREFDWNGKAEEESAEDGGGGVTITIGG